MHFCISWVKSYEKMVIDIAVQHDYLVRPRCQSEGKPV